VAWYRGAPPAIPLAGTTSKIEMIAFDGGNHIVTAEESGAVSLWPVAGSRLDPGRQRRTVSLASAVRAANLTGDVLTAAGADGSVRRWVAPRDGGPISAPTSSIETHVPSKRAAIAADGRVVVLAGIDGTVVRVDDDNVQVLGSHATKIRGLAVD